MFGLDATTTGTLLALPAGVAAGAILVTAWLAARRLRRGRPILVRPTCRRCGMTLRGEADRLPERCPECGEACRESSGRSSRLASTGIVAVGFVQPTAGRRWGLRVVSVVLLLGALWLAGALVSAPVRSVHRAAVLPTMPPRMSGAVVTDDAEQRLGRLLTEARSADGEALRRLAAEVESLIAATPFPQQLEAARIELLLHRITRDALPVEEARRLAEAFLSAPRAFTSTRVETGGTLLLCFIAPFNLRDHWCSVREIRIDGRPIQVAGRTLPTAPSPLHSLDTMSIPAPTAKGPHTLEIYWDSDVLDTIGTRVPSLGAAAFGAGLRPRREVTSLSFEVTDAPPEPLTLDPSEIGLFHYAAETPYVVLFESGERAAATLGIPGLPIQLGPGTLILRVGERAYPLRPVPTSAGLSNFTAYSLAFVDRPDGGWPATAEVEFVPTEGPMPAAAGPLPIVGAWRSPITFRMRLWLTGDRQTNYRTERLLPGPGPGPTTMTK